ncbi:hypothetical protein [Caulobacter sp. DWR1-3-2b1]|uniref:hypothetical protein n=1 Tax=Caulobacter sp. DWR1-3-2b1 TaxID=2804670 RepID=UPI003CF37BB3
MNGPEGLWESPNVGVAVFAHELSIADGPKADAAAAIALKKFLGLGGETVFLQEAVAGNSAAAGWSRDQIIQRLLFSWNVVSA